MQNKDGDDGDDAVEERNGRVCHGDAGKLGNEQGDDEFEGLHLPDLPLAHQPHDDEKDQKDDDRPYHDECHMQSLFPSPENMPNLLAARLQRWYNSGEE